MFRLAKYPESLRSEETREVSKKESQTNINIDFGRRFVNWLAASLGVQSTPQEKLVEKRLLSAGSLSSLSAASP